MPGRTQRLASTTARVKKIAVFAPDEVSNYASSMGTDTTTESPIEVTGAASQADAVTAPFSCAVSGHSFRFLPGGPDRLAALIALIDGARHHVRIIVYMFEADRCGTIIRDALVDAAQRGVTVSLIIDSFGSGDTAEGFFTPLIIAGGRMQWFGTRWTPRYLIRNHMKLYIADDDVALFGGFNVSDDYFAEAGDAQGWHDLGVEVHGPDVATLAARFDQLDQWLVDPRTSWAGLVRILRNWQAGTGTIRWLAGGPTSRLSPWARSVIRDLDHARELDLIMAYFSPGQAILRRIARIARGNGWARLILPAKSDNGATIGAARALYGYLLKRRVSIAEYRPQRLHMKTLVIDDVTYIGSANFDMRSLFINLELMVRIDDAALARRMRQFVNDHAAFAVPYTLGSWRKRGGWFTRLRWVAAWFAVSAVDFGVTRRLNLGLDQDGD
jgi:cardiolipin synthase A/B